MQIVSRKEMKYMREKIKCEGEEQRIMEGTKRHKS